MKTDGLFILLTIVLLSSIGRFLIYVVMLALSVATLFRELLARFEEQFNEDVGGVATNSLRQGL